jgi:aryl-alcohol dehydrogenase-like predicted oxidoreductase
MRTTSIPQIDTPVSVVGFGCWALSGPDVWTAGDDEDSIAAVRRAVDLGINFFDVAPIYGKGHAEEVLGRALGSRRDEVLIASKCGLIWDDTGIDKNDLSPASLHREIDDSLRRLGTDHIDLYQMHWPDPDTPVEDSMEALLEIKAAGKIRNIGVSNFSVERTERALAVGPVATHQGLMNMLEPNSPGYHGHHLEYRARSEILPLMVERRMAYLPYSPIFQGLLTDSYDPAAVDATDVRRENPNLFGNEADRYLPAAARLRELAADMGRPLQQVAINWLAAQPGMGPIIAGAQTTAQLEDTAAAGSWELTEDELETIEATLEELGIE